MEEATMTRCRIGLLVTLAFSLFVTLRAAEAQPPGKVARVGYLSAAVPECSASPLCQTMAQRLQELGYVEGQTFRLEFRTAAGQAERLPDLAAELGRLPVDVIVAAGPEATLRAAGHATRTIPIVMIAVDYDPLALGYIAGLPQPGGNITGVVLQQLELTGKRLELLKVALPQLRRVAVLWDAPSSDQWQAATEAARGVGVQLHSLEQHQVPYAYESALAAAAHDGAEALLVLMSPLFSRDRARITALAAQHRLPTMFGAATFVEAGRLMAYGVNLAHIGRRVAYYLDRLLTGTKAADLPVEQPTTFELVINLKTAQALGLTIRPSLLFQATEVLR
jgi:putative tryptophan/tyrosine transport system substrate-binding protein